jgi:5-(carboxyamino)imidazole ribonucleotide synthase
MQRNTTTCVGIIGDGQLALMLAESLTKLQINFCCLSSSRDSSMSNLFPEQTTQNKDLFFHKSTVFTLENEFLSTEELKSLLKDKAPRLFPKLSSYGHFSDKISQRNLFQSLKISSPKWFPLLSHEDIPVIKNEFPYPFVLKAAQGGYDGKGVKIIKSNEEFQKALTEFGHFEGRPLLVEEKVSIKKEVAQGFLKNSKSSTLLPLVDTVQENGVCNFVFYPADVSDSVRKEIELMLKKLMDYPLIGIFNFEFFIDDKDQVYINEGAPRPHNSQHLTINASSHSQFDLLALYLAEDKPIPETVTTMKSAMINLLGQSSGTGIELILPKNQDNIEVHPKLYGKSKCSPGRKMGHINLVDKIGTQNLRPIATKYFTEYKL